jgi:hypothetical protein
VQEYDIRRGHFKNIEGEKFKELLESKFDKVEFKDEKFKAYYGALQPLVTWVKDKNALCVETNMKTDIPEDNINETIKRYNQFLEAATGFNSKERVKRAKKKIESK